MVLFCSSETGEQNEVSKRDTKLQFSFNDNLQELKNKGFKDRCFLGGWWLSAATQLLLLLFCSRVCYMKVSHIKISRVNTVSLLSKTKNEEEATIVVIYHNVSYKTAWGGKTAQFITSCFSRHGRAYVFYTALSHVYSSEPAADKRRFSIIVKKKKRFDFSVRGMIWTSTPPGDKGRLSITDWWVWLVHCR